MAENETTNETTQESHVETQQQTAQLSPAELMEMMNSPLENEKREGRVKNRTVDEAIKADQYLSQKKVNKAPFGIVTARTVYDGQYG